MHPAKALISIAAVSLLVAGLAACQKKADVAVDKGPAETAGQKIDQTAATAGQKLDELGKKTSEGAANVTEKVGEKLEKAGEKMQDAAKNNK